MKLQAIKVIAIVVALLSSVTAQAVNALNVGAKMNIYSGWSGAVGVGAYARFDVGAGFRVEPSLMILTEKGMSVDVTAELHYPVKVARSVALYPLAGLSLNDPGKFGLGMNFGGGVDYALNNRITLTTSAKWVAQTQEGVKNPFVISFGGGFRF